MKLYESLRSPRRNPLQPQKVEVAAINEDSKSQYQSIENSVSRGLPVNLTIKLDSPIEDESDMVKINDDGAVSQCSSSHISRHSSPQSVTTMNKSLNVYLSAMSPSPARPKIVN